MWFAWFQILICDPQSIWRKQEKNQIEFVLAIFKGGYFNFSWAIVFFKYCCVCTKIGD
jgi:uncharacterized membrane protein